MEDLKNLDIQKLAQWMSPRLRNNRAYLIWKKWQKADIVNDVFDFEPQTRDFLILAVQYFLMGLEKNEENVLGAFEKGMHVILKHKTELKIRINMISLRGFKKPCKPLTKKQVRILHKANGFTKEKPTKIPYLQSILPYGYYMYKDWFNANSIYEAAEVYGIRGHTQIFDNRKR